jgi:hypothetical protein
VQYILTLLIKKMTWNGTVGNTCKYALVLSGGVEDLEMVFSPFPAFWKQLYPIIRGEKAKWDLDPASRCTSLSLQ